MRDADDSGEQDSDTFSESTARELAEKNPIDMERETFPLNMGLSETTAKRGFARIGSRGSDADFTLELPGDGGFLGRAQGWER